MFLYFDIQYRVREKDWPSIKAVLAASFSDYALVATSSIGDFECFSTQLTSFLIGGTVNRSDFRILFLKQDNYLELHIEPIKYFQSYNAGCEALSKFILYFSDLLVNKATCLSSEPDMFLYPSQEKGFRLGKSTLQNELKVFQNHFIEVIATLIAVVGIVYFKLEKGVKESAQATMIVLIIQAAVIFAVALYRYRMKRSIIEIAGETI